MGPKDRTVYAIQHRSFVEVIGVLAPILHRLVAQPAVYDLVQRLVGADRVRARIAPYLTGSVLDVGAGTGTIQPLVAGSYVWLDNDRQKLRGYAGDCAVLGDATALPVAGRSVDTGLCVAVSHHLTDTDLSCLFVELARACRRVVFLDAVWCSRVRSRLLWRYDRGSYPRTAERLRDAMAAQFDITAWEMITVQHRYVLGVGLAR